MLLGSGALHTAASTLNVSDGVSVTATVGCVTVIGTAIAKPSASTVPPNDRLPDSMSLMPKLKLAEHSSEAPNSMVAGRVADEAQLQEPSPMTAVPLARDSTGLMFALRRRELPWFKRVTVYSTPWPAGAAVTQD